MYYQATRYEQPRNDNEPGYIYLMEAIGYHGILPGRLLRRCKIGLSRNPELRLQNFHANQPPCDIRILKTIYVQDMEAVEKKLHEQFRNCNVRLIRSKEWFDLSPWDFAAVMWSMNRHDQAINVSIPLISRPGFAKLLILSGLGLLLFTALSGQFHAPSEQASHSVSKAVASHPPHSKIKRMH
jgi:hypothetical protein